MSTLLAAAAMAENNAPEAAIALLKADEAHSANRGGNTPPTEATHVVLALGAIVLALYYALFTWETEVLALSARGGWYFLVPVVIAFVFSSVHGTFTGKFWTALGLVAKK